MLQDLFVFLRNLLQKAHVMEYASELEVAVSVITVAGAAAAGLRYLVGKGRRCLRYWINKKPILWLNNALAGYAIASKKEVEYQVKNYVAPCFADKDKDIRGLLRRIRESSGEKTTASVFSIVGAPACGKTTTMRYLYCRLSKSRRCVYFQMQNIANMGMLENCLFRQKIKNDISDYTSVVGFFDGMDEAYDFLRSIHAESMEEAFGVLFCRGDSSKIHDVFREHELSLDCVVTSLRPEFLERSTRSIRENQFNNIYMKIYRIEKMTNKKAVRIFKSLKELKRMDSALDKEERRHEYRYPPFGQRTKYVRRLRRILKDNPDSLFRYPMYLRYAYAFMQLYGKREADDGRLGIRNNIAVSFDALVKAIFKWEFHVYYKGKGMGQEEKAKRLRQFEEKMDQCAQAIASKLAESLSVSMNRKQFDHIVELFFPDEMNLAIAHCLMKSDEDGQEFSFCHSTFHDYFFAKYMYEKADYPYRKEALLSDRTKSYLRDMYYSILCREEALNEKMSQSIVHPSHGYMTLRDYQLTEGEGAVEILDEPRFTLAEILEYLPCIRKFRYRGAIYDRAQVEEMRRDGRLDLRNTGWSDLAHARWLIHPHKVRHLMISGLPLKNVESLRTYNNVKYFDMRFADEAMPILDHMLEEIRGMHLGWMHIHSESGKLCEKIYSYLKDGCIEARAILVESPNYSQAHLKMYKLNQDMREAGREGRFYPSVRSDEGKAKGNYERKIDQQESELLCAVYQLESDEAGMLGLDKGNPTATYWNGICLAKYLHNSCLYSEGQEICQELAAHIPIDQSEISIKFGKVYGTILCMQNYNPCACNWLNNSYVHGAQHLKNNDVVHVGLYLYKSRIRCFGTELWEAGVELGFLKEKLEEDIKKLSDTKHNVCYAWYKALRCGEGFTVWIKGEKPPADLYDIVMSYKKYVLDWKKDGIKLENIFNAVYLEMMYANRTMDTVRGAQVLEELSRILDRIMELQEEASAKEEASRQGSWIAFHEQKLYYMFLANERKEALETVEELMNYPYRRDDLSIVDYEYIQKAINGDGGESETEADKHRLWGRLWF